MSLKQVLGTLATSFSIGLGLLKTTLSVSSVGLAVDRPLYVDGIGGRTVTITVADSPYTPGDEYTILVDASGGNVTISLPAVATRPGQVYRVFKVDTSGNTVTLDPAGAETMDGLSTYSMSVFNKGCGFVAAPTEWKFTAAVSRDSFGTPLDETFGQGFDGDVTVAGTTTQTRNTYYSNLVVTGTLNPDRFVVFVQNRLSGNGTINAAGANAANRIGGTGDIAVRYLAGGSTGGDGGVNGNGQNGTARTNSISTFGGGGAGGAGGASATRTGGNGGTISGPTADLGRPPDPWVLLAGRFKGGNQASSGSGGGGGGGEVNSTSGGGGAGGSFTIVRARICDFSGTITAKGGNGGASTIGTGVGSGGGGGGGGGAVILVTQELRTTPTISVLKGTAGAGSGTGSPGVDGQDGYSSIIQMVQ